MDQERFWSIVESSRKGTSHDQGAQAAALETALTALTVAEVEEFEARFRLTMAEAYRWDLWAAANLILGGCSDDGFEYFGNWLISMGKECFESAMRHPDSLAQYIQDMDDDSEDFEFQDFAIAAGNVWERKTGKNILDMTNAGVNWPYRPAGERWNDGDDEYFINTLPQLWARLGG